MGMRANATHTKFGRGQIRDIWETILPYAWVKKIQRIATKKKVSMSWVARFCVFRLIQRDLENFTGVFCDELESIREEMRGSSNRKRFFICFYGEDELYLRIFARKAGLTVSMLVRLALYLFLHLLDGNKVTSGDFFWNGIKIIKEIRLLKTPLDLFLTGFLLL